MCQLWEVFQIGFLIQIHLILVVHSSKAQYRIAITLAIIKVKLLHPFKLRD